MNGEQETTSRSISRRQATTVLPLFGAGVLWVLLSNRYPFVDTRGSDVALLMLLALVASALWTFVAPVLKGRVGWTFLWRATFLALLFAGVVPALNAVFDRHVPHVFTTIVNSKRCYKSSCTWELRGANGLPVQGPTMTLKTLRTLDANPGDSLVLGIKPGLFGRAWIASRDVHKVERSRLACARLAVPATSGDTTQLTKLLSEGLSIEDEEPALDCETPLMVASKAGEASTVEFLLRHGADPNHAAPDGQTPLMAAVIDRSLSVVRLLLTHGADPRAVLHRGSGWTRDIVGLALDMGDTAITRVIANAIPNTPSSPNGH